MSLTLGITHCTEWSNYERWIKSAAPSLNIARLKAGESTLEDIKKCDAVILSGGADVHPSRYGKTEYIKQYSLKDFDEARDEMELKILEEVVTNEKPLLGICRGLQITNVFFKGSLIPDLPSFEKQGHSSADNKKDTVHNVSLRGDTYISRIINETKGTINSHHHQSANTIGQGLKVSALSEDGVVEAIEKQNPGNSFFMLVQWHPERMDTANPFSGKLREAFIKSLPAT